MKALNHFKECSQFWKPSVARRITLYFTVFGLLVFYLTSVAYLVQAKKQLANSVTRIVQGQVSRLPGRDTPDFLWSIVGQAQPELGSLAHTLTSLASATHTILDVSIYARRSDDAPWQRLHLDGEEILRSEPAGHRLSASLTMDRGKHFIQPDADLYVSRRKMAMFVDISTPLDAGQYFFRIGIARQGVATMLAERALPFAAISLAAVLIFRVIGYFFARRLAAPIEILSDAAARVAGGDLSPTIPPMGKTEIGTLGRNFNQMILGLREWQRIKRMEVELEKGRAIQHDFLPTEIPNLPDWDIATCFYPAREVSGDFYDVFDLPDGLIGLVIADVCDKGVGSALYMALIRSLIRVYAEQALPAGRELEVVRLTNSYLSRHHGQEGMFATLFFGVLDAASGNLVYINGGHEPLYVIGKNGVKAELPPTGPAVGLMEDIHFEVARLQLGPGDLLLGLTDGVTEALSPEDELFTRSRLKDLLAQPATSSRELLERIRRQVVDFVGTAPPSDDLTMLAVQRMV